MDYLTVTAVAVASAVATYSLSMLFNTHSESQTKQAYQHPEPKEIPESQKHGIDYVRRLTEGEIEILVKSMENVNEHIPKNKYEITWLNLFYNQKFTVGHDLQQKLDSLVHQLIEENSPYKTNYVISYGFLINPAGSKKYQQFHYDYTTTSMNIFVPMTKVTFKNATQFLRRKMTTEMDYWNNFGEVEDIMQKEKLDYVEISQIAMKPFLVTKMHPSTCHRGFANHDNYDRIVFWITIDNHLHYLEEDVTHKEFFQKESVEAQ